MYTREEMEALIPDSPFLDLSSPFTAGEAVKMAVLLPWVVVKAAILAVCVVFWVVTVWLLHRALPLLLWAVGLRRSSELQPREWPWYQGAIRAFIALGSRLVLVAFAVWPLRLRGKHNIAAARRAHSIVVFNHHSYMDPLVLAALFAAGGLAKSGVASLPVAGTFARALQFVFVTRAGARDPSTRASVRQGAARELARRAADPRAPLVMVAPEATTKSAHVLLPFKTGAFVPGLPVTPVLIRYRARRFNPSWSLGPGPTWFHMLRLAAQWVNVVEVTVLPPYWPSEDERRDAKLFAHNVRRLMAAELAAPMVAQGVAEHAAMERAGVTVDWTGRRVIVPWREKTQ